MSDEHKRGIEPRPLEVAMVELGNVENPKPLRPEEIDVGLLRNRLEAAGLNLEVTEADKEALRHSQIRTYTKGKGAVVARMVGDPEKLEEKLLKLSEGWYGIVSSKTKEPIEGSESRGLRQFVAGVLAVAVEAITVEEFCDSTNLRVRKGLEKSGHIKGEKGEFSKDTASIPPGTVKKAYDFLINGLR